MATKILPVLAISACLCACAALVQSRPDLINRAIADANLDCSGTPYLQREQCARDTLTQVYPTWKSDQNADILEDALSALGRISAAVAAGTVSEAQAQQTWQAYFASLLQIGDSRIIGLQQRREEQAAAWEHFREAMQRESVTLQQIGAPPTVTHCSTNALAGTLQTTCTQN